MIGLAPAILAAMIAAIPTVPVPNTAIGNPARTFMLRSTAPAPVISPQPIGASRSSGRSRALSGTRTTLR